MVAYRLILYVSPVILSILGPSFFSYFFNEGSSRLSKTSILNKNEIFWNRHDLKCIPKDLLKKLYQLKNSYCINSTNDDLSKDLSEFEKLKQEFKNIDLPKEEKKEERKPLFADEEVIPSRLDRKLEEKPEIPSRLKDRNEEKKYTPGPQVFSSVFVNNKEEKPQEKVVEEKVEEKPKNISLFTIADDDNLELPSLKKEEKKEGPNIDNITGETYNINR